MREMGIAGISPGPNLSQRRRDHQVYPYLLRGLAITEPNQVWGIDITYIRLAKGWLYLVAVMDWFSRYVVSWELSDSLALDFVLSAVARAFVKARPELSGEALILNSDQGSQFTSPSYLELLHSAGVRVSMDGKGRASDNIFTERLWRSLKYEEVYLHDYQSPKDAVPSTRGKPEVVSAAIWSSTTTSGCTNRSTIRPLPRACPERSEGCTLDRLTRSARTSTPSLMEYSWKGGSVT
jgi:putative transposase